MTNVEFAGYIAEIEKFYSKTIPKEAKTRAWERMHHEPVKAFYRAIDRMMMEHTGYMPPMSKIIEITAEEGRKIKQEEALTRENEAKREKEEFRQGQARAFKDDSQIAKQTLMLMRAIYTRKITRNQIVEHIAKLDMLHPKAGFMEHTAELKKFYVDRQLPMDKEPGVGFSNATVAEIRSER